MWNAIYTGPSQERASAEYLSQIGLEVVCPLVTERKRVKVRGLNAYRIAEVIRPIFPRYIFVKADPRIYGILSKLPERLGTPKVVRCGEQASVVDGEVVEALREMGEVLDSVDLSHLKINSLVSLGTHAGLSAIITSVKNLLSMQEISVKVKLLGRHKEITVPALSVAPL